MAYDRFDDLITVQHHVVVKDWPLKTFCNPSAITSRADLELLYNAWKSGRTYFQRLTHEEMEAWENNRISSCMEFVPPPAELIPALASPQPPAEPVPPPTLLQPPIDMTLVSELPRQDRLALAPHPLPNVPPPLTPVTNLTYGSALLTTPRPTAPNPETIAMMIRIDPGLQNVDPALIAMGITQGDQHQVTPMTATTPLIEQPPNCIPGENGSKRCWQEVITPNSYDGRAAKKPRNQRKSKQSKNPRVAQSSEN